MNHQESIWRTLGYWEALNDILNYFNTLENNIVDKKELYHYIFKMRPPKCWMN